MESRDRVLMILSAGQQRRHRHKEQTCGHSRRTERVGRLERVAWKHIQYHV